MKRLSVGAILLVCLPFSGFTQGADAREVLAVLGFAAAGVSEAEARIFTDVLSARIVDTGAYRVIEPEQRDAILQEIEFSLSDWSDEGRQLEAGRLLAASRLVVGSIGRIGSWVIATVRLIDVASGETVRSATEKYPDVEALIDGAAGLAGRTLGVPVSGAALQPPGPQSARMLISSVKQNELREQLERMQRRTKAAEYERWLKINGFSEYEREAVLQEKMAFLEEYLYQTNTRGHAVDLALSAGSLGGEPLTGLTTAWSFQFNSMFSAGVGLDVSMRLAPVRFGSAAVGPLLIFGDKVESLAVLASAGFGGADGPMVSVRCGLYFHNFYVGYAGQYPLGDDGAFSGIEAGYSLFFGERRSWPPKPEPRNRPAP